VCSPAHNPWNSECPPRCSLALGRPLPPLVLSDDEVQQLQGIGNSRSLPHSILQRAQIVLACWAGETNTAIAMSQRALSTAELNPDDWRRIRDALLYQGRDLHRRSFAVDSSRRELLWEEMDRCLALAEQIEAAFTEPDS
jgi:hypothetical protein